ncbi:hypothetical protein THRCLA_21672 [Thraustotheca clavata]|uniref:Uncharacterized protein n=1 Tax=Thraustotheca clavata TaxID=74557 RepID=A0A1V9ZRL4_9STRA|nr:hypothetical protein THRCLA_21672 [Thraustotheca clavata]
MESLCNSTLTCTVLLGDSLCVRGSIECYNYNCLYLQHGIVYCTNPTYNGCQNGVICPKDVSTPTPIPTNEPTPLPTNETPLPTNEPTPNATTISIPTTLPMPTTSIPIATTSSPQPANSSSNKTSIVLGVILGIAVIIGLALWLFWRRKQKREADEERFVAPSISNRRNKQESIVLSKLHMNVESSAIDSMATKSMFNTVGRQSNHEFMTEKSDWWQNSAQNLLVEHETKTEPERNIQVNAEERKAKGPVYNL